MRVETKRDRGEGPGHERLSVLIGLGSIWPNLRYYSLAFISAWILLCTTGPVIFEFESNTLNGTPAFIFYLCSGTAHGTCLIAGGAFSEKAELLIMKKRVVLNAAFISSIFTALTICQGFGIDIGIIPFALFSAVTGATNALIILRIGYIYRDVSNPQAFFFIAASALLANLLFFLCTKAPTLAALIIVAALPFLSAFATFMEGPSPCAEMPGETIPITALPKRYFTRMIITVLVFSFAAGVIKGFTALNIPLQQHSELTVLSVFGSFIVLLAIVVTASGVLAVKQYDLSKIYYPIIVTACMVIVLVPLFGGGFNPLEYVTTSIAYNMLILLMWGLFSELANRTTLNPIRVFGFGRGASALATTAGWLVARGATWCFLENQLFLNGLFIVLTLAIALVTTTIFNERTVNSALEKTRRREQSVESLPETPAFSGEDYRKQACDKIATKYMLTIREKDVLYYMSRGRDTNFIADELGIAYNTTKGYVRNVYVKLDVHSRRELLDFVENILAELIEENSAH